MAQGTSKDGSHIVTTNSLSKGNAWARTCDGCASCRAVSQRPKDEVITLDGPPIRGADGSIVLVNVTDGNEKYGM